MMPTAKQREVHSARDTRQSDLILDPPRTTRQYVRGLSIAHDVGKLERAGSAIVHDVIQVYVPELPLRQFS